MLSLFKETKIAYFISTFSGMVLGLTLVTVFSSPAPAPMFILEEFFFSLLFFLSFFLWSLASGLFLNRIASKKVLKLNKLRNNCDLEHYTTAYEAFAKKTSAKVFPLGKTTKTFIWLGLSTAYLTSGNNPAAFEALSAIKYFPKRRCKSIYELNYYNNFFVYHLQVNNIPAAIQSLTQMEQILQHGKLREPIRAQCAVIYVEKQCMLRMAKGNYDGCEAVFEQAFQRNENTLANVGAKYTLGKIYLHENRLREAKQAFEYVVTHGGSSRYPKEAAALLETLEQALH